IVAAVDLAERLGLPVEWIPISSGARIAMDSGTENLDATARVARRIITFTERGGVVHLIVYGVNVGAQSYWDALATMIGHTRGALIMTPDASMVLTGRAALEASGGVAAEDEVAIGGFERIMGPNGEAQYYAGDLAAALRTLAEHYRYAYVVPGEAGPRLHRTTDPLTRDITTWPYPAEHGHGFATVGEIFDDATNPGRKRPFAMRAVMQALIDQDGGQLEHGAEIARAVVNFDGPLLFLVVSRYHGGAYVVFSRSLNPRMRAMALTGSYASVIGGGAAAAVVFTREVRARVAAHPTVRRAREAPRTDPTAAARDAYEPALAAATRAPQAEVAAEFDDIHTVERACRVGSLDEIIEPRRIRPALIRALDEAGRERHDTVMPEVA